MKRSRIWSAVLMYVKILLGSVSFAVGFRFFLYPNAIVSGGVTGISMIINYLTGAPVGVMMIVINIPLFVFAWKEFGLGFMLSSLVGMLASSLMVDALSLLELSITSEPFLACVYGGIFSGLGLGLVYSSGATTGGIDIVAKFLRSKFPFVNLGTMLLSLDVVVIAIFALLFKKYDSSMYAIVAMFISSKMVDLVLYGASNSKLCFIISDGYEEIKTAIVQSMSRGVTLLEGEGAYTGAQKKVILCAIKPQQIVELRKIVSEVDEGAFVIVTDSHEVFGNGFLSINDFG